METIAHNLRKTIGLDAASIGFGAIERAVRQRIAASNSISLDRYRQILRESPAELRALIDALVVPETWFFRDRGAFAAVVAEAQTRQSRKLRYLSVPCATGEEPLSLAMSLLDAGLPADRFHIDAFDISERLVQFAKRGAYGRNSFRGDHVDFRARYFQETAEGCSILPGVRAQTTFRQANLLDDLAFQEAQIYDAVFCRNLLIYFDADAQTKALGKISRLLRDDGLLCVAPAETGLLLRHGFVPADIPHAFAFRNERRATKTPVPATKAGPTPVTRLAPPPAPLAHACRIDPPMVAASAPEANPLPLAEFADAMRLADEGRLDEVTRICQGHIEAHGPTADAYYLLALVSDAAGKYEDATQLYRKTLYLDPNHRDALAHFSLLAARLGETDAAGALRRRALRTESTTP